MVDVILGIKIEVKLVVLKMRNLAGQDWMHFAFDSGLYLAIHVETAEIHAFWA